MPANDPSPFEVAAVALEEATWGRRPPWRFPFGDYPSGTNQYEQDWEHLEIQTRAELDGVARQWVLDQKWPKLPKQHAYFWHLRLVAGYRFLHQFPKDIPSIFAYPQIPVHEVLEWMLVPWWASVGVHEALYGIEARNLPLQASDN